MQRAFTKNSSPMNCSLILEEYIRENRDLKKVPYIALLDAKAAFDIVNHSSLMRKLFHIGVDGITWNLIHSLHKEAQTVVRWCGQTSKPFEVKQGVRQGGVQSTDLYKVYSNHLLNRVTGLLIGGIVGEVCCAAPACADDMTFTSYDNPGGVWTPVAWTKIQCSNHWAKESIPWHSCQRLNISLEAMHNLPR